MDKKSFIPVTQDLAITCPYCGETMDVEVEIADGTPQQFEEDCATCCQPVYLTIRIGYDGNVACEVKTEEEE